MVDISLITGLLPLTIGGIIASVINTTIITIVLALTDKILAHEVSLKNSSIMASISYFIIPIILTFASISFAFSGYVIPLIVWIILGELLLKGSRKGRLTAAAAAFIIYIILNIIGVPGMILGLIPF